MGFFGKLFGRKNGTTAGTNGHQLWYVECGPDCGFRAHDHNKDELVLVAQHHMKFTHKTNLTPAEVAADIKPLTK